MTRKTKIKIIALLTIFVMLSSIIFSLFKTNYFHFKADTNPSTISFYVSPDGSDANPGTVDQPFATITKARDKIRELKTNGQFNGPVDVIVNSGTYNISQTINFTSQDSGTSQYPITYRGQGATTILSGAQKITPSWNQCQAGDAQCQNGLGNFVGGSIYYANVGTDYDFNSLFINNARATRARTPNLGHDNRIDNYLKPASLDTAKDGDGNVIPQKWGFQFNTGDINPNWTNLSDVELLNSNSYTQSRFHIDHIDGDKVYVAGTPSVAFNYTGTLTNANYFVDNVFEGLDTPGEWYLNKTTGYLYYWPKEGENIASSDVEVPETNQLINITGTQSTIDGTCSPSYRANYVQYLNFKGLSFRFTDWALPTNGYPGNEDAFKVLPSTVQLTYDDHISFTNNTFSELGSDAFSADKVENLLVSQNNIYDVGQNGIRLYSTNLNDCISPNNVFSNNTIHDIGQVNFEGRGIGTLVVKDTTISHNEVYNGGYAGITVIPGGNGYNKELGTDNNVIEYNDVHNVMRELVDGGGIYVDGRQRGSLIYNNLVHDTYVMTLASWWTDNGIYVDGGGDGVTVENNIVYNSSNPYFQQDQKYGVPNPSLDNPVLNNIFIRSVSSQTAMAFLHDVSTFQHNIMYISGLTDSPLPWSIVALKGGSPSADNNLYYNSAGSQYIKFRSYTNVLTNFAQRQASGTDTHSLVSDPLFTDPLAGTTGHSDFSLQSGSPALALGFTQIDTSQIGPQTFSVTAAALSCPVIYKATYHLTGTKTEAVTNVLINDIPATVNNTENTWALDVDLTIGNNTITVAGKDDNGNSSSVNTIVVPRHKLGDATGDGKVDYLDLSKLATSWGKDTSVDTGTNYLADFNEDGSVNYLDFSTLATNWKK